MRLDDDRWHCVESALDRFYFSCRSDRVGLVCSGLPLNRTPSFLVFILTQLFTEHIDVPLFRTNFVHRISGRALLFFKALIREHKFPLIFPKCHFLVFLMFFFPLYFFIDLIDVYHFVDDFFKLSPFELVCLVTSFRLVVCKFYYRISHSFTVVLDQRHQLKLFG